METDGIQIMLSRWNVRCKFTSDGTIFMSKLLGGIVSELSRLYQINSSLEKSVKILFTGDILTNALTKANKSVNNFIVTDSVTSTVTSTSCGKSFFQICGITIYPTVLSNYLKKIGYTFCSDHFLIYVTAIIEEFVAEIIKNLPEKNDIKDSDILFAINEWPSLLYIVSRIFFVENGWDIETYSKTHQVLKNKNGLLRVISNENGKFIISNDIELQHCEIFRYKNLFILKKTNVIT